MDEFHGTSPVFCSGIGESTPRESRTDSDPPSFSIFNLFTSNYLKIKVHLTSVLHSFLHVFIPILSSSVAF